jgi:predicted Zn-dependent protease
LTARPLSSLFARLRLPRVWVPLLTAVALAVVALAGPYLYAAHGWHMAERALARHRPREAAKHLDRCLQVWPRSPEVHLLAARAARLLDDSAAAEHHLTECQRLEVKPSEASLLEWALQQVESGEVERLDEFLRARAKADPSQADLVWEALAAGYLRLYRFYEAMHCLEKCLEHGPENVRALYLRGQAWERVHAYPKAVADYSQVVARDPDHDSARLRLANCLLENGEPAEAVPHLEHLRGRRPDDPEVLVRLAFAWDALGKLGPSLELIDRVLAVHPDLPSALTARGRLAFEAERLAEAEHWLRRAIAANAYDRAAHYALQQCLEQQGKQVEAEAEKKELKRVEETITRLIEIANRLMPRRPHDPTLHHELGAIFLRMGKDDLAVRWFHSALGQDPDYRPAHESLAEYYGGTGDAERAAWHQARTAPRKEGPREK